MFSPFIGPGYFNHQSFNTNKYNELILISEQEMKWIPVRRLMIRAKMMVNNIPTAANHKKDNLYKKKTPSLEHTDKFRFNWSACKNLLGQ